MIAGIVLGADEGLSRELQDAVPEVRASTTCWPSPDRTSRSSRQPSWCLRQWPAFRAGSGRYACSVRSASYVLAVGLQPSVVRAGHRRCAGLARLARLASARPLVLPTRRRHRPPRMESLQPARTGLPALLRRCVRHLRARPAHRTPARGLSGATPARYAARSLDRLRPLHRTAPLARLRAVPIYSVLGNATGRAGDALPARARADLRGRPPDPARPSPRRSRG